MRFYCGMRCMMSLALGGLLVTGCFWHKSKPATTTLAPAKQGNKMIVTPDAAPLGKVIRVNGSARFAVLNFPIGSVPPIGQMLNAYRQGLKVGELKVAGPQGDENTIADITSGDVRVGDEARGN